MTSLMPEDWPHVGTFLIETFNAGDGEGPKITGIDWFPAPLDAELQLRKWIDIAGEGPALDESTELHGRKVRCWSFEDRATEIRMYQIAVKDGQPALIPVAD